MRAIKLSFRLLASLLFIASGIAHLAWPATYERIVPPVLPAHQAIVLISGIAEIVGGTGLLVPRFRRSAAWGLIALLIAVFPANVYMAVDAERFADLPVSPALLWLRLPLQAVLIAWLWWAGIRSTRGANDVHG